MSIDPTADAGEIVREMILEACLAGAYEACIHQHPEIADGFTVLRRKHSEKAARLAERLTSDLRQRSAPWA